MAEQEQPRRPRLNAGMFKGTSPLDQPSGTVRHARNASLNVQLGAWNNEFGVSLETVLPPDSIVIGTVPLTDNRIVLFIKRLNRSEIGIWNAGTYTVLYNPIPTQKTELGFSTDHPIQGTSREQADGDLIVYWTDGLNPPRALNVTRQAASPNNARLYGIDPSLSPDTVHVNRLNLFPHGGPVPHAELKGVFSGGGCKTGVYHIALGYSDHDLIETNTLTVGNPVPIVDEFEGIQPIESYDGAPPDVLSGKSIVWTVSNLNTDMKYLTVSIIAQIGEVKTAYRLKDIEIEGNTSLEVSFTGAQTTSTDSPENVLIDRVEYSTVDTMEQFDNVLYLGGLSSEEDIGYQPYANFIKASPCVHVFDPFDAFWMTDDFLMKKKAPSGSQDVRNGYRFPKNIHDLKGYQRDEVYAFYIAFILKSGKMSYAYHIPGRPPLTGVNPSTMEALHNGAPVANTDIPILLNEDYEVRNAVPAAGDIAELTTSGSDTVGYLYQWYDFSHLTPSRGMNYWRNLGEFYPDNDNWDIRDASLQSPTGSIRNIQVRHHRFPGNRNREFTTVKSSNANELTPVIKKKAVVHWFWFGDFTQESLGSNDYEITAIFQGPSSNWQGARALANQSLGGAGALHDEDIPDAFTIESDEACDPRLNLQIRNFIQSGALGCSNVDQIEYIYDTQIPSIPNLPVAISWDPPFAGPGLGCPLGAQIPHCFYSLTANVVSSSGGTITLNNTGANFGSCFTPTWTMFRGGFLAWVECEDVLANDPANTVTHEVQALGICFEDLKVPQSIADKAQGFRIYYAKRTHENRTIIGQAPLHQMYDRYNVNLAGCHLYSDATHERDYLLPGGIPAPVENNFERTNFSFHDFYLLRETPSLAQATHIRLQYSLGMFSFAGPTLYNIDGVESIPADPSTSTPATPSCFRPGVVTSFHLSGAHEQPDDVQWSYMNYLLKDKGRTYVKGNSIFEAAGLGFQLPIYNIGGHSLVALKTRLNLPYLPSGIAAGWRELRSDRSGLKYIRYTNITGQTWPGADESLPDDKRKGLMLHMVNLHAFKTDVYSPVDTQTLVWTGYEVVGDRFKDFIVADNFSNPQPGPNAPNGVVFKTEPIFGGDTFICRYGYRMTHREEVTNMLNGAGIDLSGIDHKTVIMTLVESTENINFRHVQDDKQPYFPGDSLANVLKAKADTDLSYSPDPLTGNMKYNKDYSAVNDLKVILPLPFYLEQNSEFPVRVQRSNTASASALFDNFRYYSAAEFKDLNNRYGKLWKLSSMGNRLLFHMEDSLFISKGKQKMKVSEGEEALVGTGDIFQQEPDLVIHTDAGYLGTRSRFSAIVTPQGYFFVDVVNRRVFLVSDGPEDLSSAQYGMEQWFRTNMPFSLEEYNVNFRDDSFITGVGFHAVWDQKFERVILTKRDLVPTNEFKRLFKGTFNRIFDANSIPTGIISVNGILYSRVFPQALWTEVDIDRLTVSPENNNLYLFTQTGWTISFKLSPSKEGKGVWESFHDYVPYMYSYTGTDVVSFDHSQQGLFRHNDVTSICSFYGNTYPFEIEAVINSPYTKELLFHAFSYLTEVSEDLNGRTEHNAGFTSFAAYTSDHFTGEIPLEYLINIRRVGSEWRVNQLRDLSKQNFSTAAYYTGPFTQSNHGIQGLTTTGTFNSGTWTGSLDRFFTIDGMYEVPNPNALDLTRPWYTQSKFTGRYMGIRLISDSLENKLITLYSINSDFRPLR